MNIKNVFIFLSVILTSTCAYAEDQLKLKGTAMEHKFVRVESQVPGRWIVIGPNALTYSQTFAIENMSLGQLGLARRESIILSDGKECVFVGPTGFYGVIQFPENANDVNQLIVQVLPDDSPTPPKPYVPDNPTPTPTPTPKPVVVPDGKYGISPKVYNWAKLTNDKVTAIKISKIFESIAAQISAGAIKSVDEIIVVTSSQNKEAAKGQYEVWKNNFFVPLNEELNRLGNVDGRLLSLTEHAECWREIAVGLQLYGES